MTKAAGCASVLVSTRRAPSHRMRRALALAMVGSILSMQAATVARASEVAAMRTATIVVALPGASPERVERMLTVPSENAIHAMGHTGRIRSNSWEGVSQTDVDLAPGPDPEAQLQALRDRLATLRTALPPQAGDARVEWQPATATAP